DAPPGGRVFAPTSNLPARAEGTLEQRRALLCEPVGANDVPAVEYAIAKVPPSTDRNTRFQALNLRGGVAGLRTKANGRVRCFLYADGLACEMGARGCQPSVVLDLNSRAQVVGQAMTREGYEAIVYEEGEIYPLGNLGLAPSQACGINDRGQIV